MTRVENRLFKCNDPNYADMNFKPIYYRCTACYHISFEVASGKLYGQSAIPLSILYNSCQSQIIIFIYVDLVGTCDRLGYPVNPPSGDASISDSSSSDDPSSSGSSSTSSVGDSNSSNSTPDVNTIPAGPVPHAPSTSGKNGNSTFTGAADNSTSIGADNSNGISLRGSSGSSQAIAVTAMLLLIYAWRLF